MYLSTKYSGLAVQKQQINLVWTNTGGTVDALHSGGLGATQWGVGGYTVGGWGLHSGGLGATQWGGGEEVQ